MKTGMLPQPEPDIGDFRFKRRGSLCCPACEKPVPLLGRRRVIRHPYAEHLQEASFGITAWWCGLVILMFSISLVALDGDVLGRGTGWLLMFLPPLPGFTIFFVVRCFPRYRVTQCPFCGFSETIRLRDRQLKSSTTD